MSNGRRVPYRGMTYSDYSEILSAFGCHPVIVRPKDTKQVNWTKDRSAFYDIYAYIESGFPVLTSFKGHVASIVGHTVATSFVGVHAPESGPFFNSYSFLSNTSWWTTISSLTHCSVIHLIMITTEITFIPVHIHPLKAFTLLLSRCLKRHSCHRISAGIVV